MMQSEQMTVVDLEKTGLFASLLHSEHFQTHVPTSHGLRVFGRSLRLRRCPRPDIAGCVLHLKHYAGDYRVLENHWREGSQGEMKNRLGYRDGGASSAGPCS